MRFPLTLTICCLIAAGAASTAFAQDGDAQQRALEALRKYTAEQEQKSQGGLTAETPQAKGTAEESGNLAGNSEDKARRALEEKYQAEGQQMTKESASQASAAEMAAEPEPEPEPTTKEGKLAKLLELYMADEVTSKEYHMQRAAIIAGD